MSGEEKPPTPKKVVIQVNRPGPKLGVDLTKTPKNWLPDARNARLEFRARIYAYQGGKWVYPGEPRKITFILKEVSKEKGICLNFPSKNKSNENPDLFFADDDDRMKEFTFDEDKTDKKNCPTTIVARNDNPSHKYHYLKATTKTAVTEAVAVVRCEDYGAFGVLEASAPECEAIPPREAGGQPGEGVGPNDIKIPRDDNDNKIADIAPQDDGGAAGDSDGDDEPEIDGYDGDGLTNYEEYRGFIVKRGRGVEHIRTSIKKKDLFIYDKDGLGTGFFHKSGLVLHFIPKPDYYAGDSSKKDASPDAGKQIINFNAGNATKGEQHALRLVNERIRGCYGYCYGDGPGLPKVTNRVAINKKLCTGKDEHADQLSAVIAHEMGHAVNVFHHGEEPNSDHVCGGKVTDEGGRVTSGDVTCVMRYDNYNYTQWCHVKDDGSHCRHPIPDEEDPGTTFCDSKRGTDCNFISNDHRNDATVGECKTHIRIKDW